MGDPAGGARRRRKSRCLKSLSLNSAGKHDRNKAGGLGTASWRRADTSPASHCPDRNSLRGVLCLYKAARFSSAASPDRSPDKHDSLQLTLHRFFFFIWRLFTRSSGRWIDAPIRTFIHLLRVCLMRIDSKSNPASRFSLSRVVFLVTVTVRSCWSRAAD